MTDALFHVKRLRKTHRSADTPCACGAPRENPKDGYCRKCRARYSQNYRHRPENDPASLRARIKELEQQAGLQHGTASEDQG